MVLNSIILFARLIWFLKILVLCFTVVCSYVFLLCFFKILSLKCMRTDMCKYVVRQLQKYIICWSTIMVPRKPLYTIISCQSVVVIMMLMEICILFFFKKEKRIIVLVQYLFLIVSIVFFLLVIKELTLCYG